MKRRLNLSPLRYFTLKSNKVGMYYSTSGASNNKLAVCRRDHFPSRFVHSVIE